jgi:type VII secretion-associated protein (TIGR03931 family)
VSTCVVEVGPATVRGPRPAADDIVVTALGCIDDEIAVLDEAPVAVPALWRQVFRTVLPDEPDATVLVCPTWWSQTRVERVREAAAACSAKVSVRQRANVLERGIPAVSTVVEIAPEFVVIARAGDVVTAEPRLGYTEEIARSVADHVGPSTSVLVDTPVGVVGGTELAGAISECLRGDGVVVTTVHPDRVLRSSREPRGRRQRAMTPPRQRAHRSALRSALIVSVALLCIALAVGTDEAEPVSIPMTLLVEGRVALKVPALWAVQRITSGAGSARVEVMAPDHTVALLVTQSQVRESETLTSTSATLRNALDGQQAGVFSQFKPEDRRADRPAVTYRELRGGRQIDWAVFVDDTLRIAVGCQSAPGDEAAVRDVCEEAIRSAHTVV